MSEQYFTVKQARQMKGLTQAQMAQEMGISRDTYRRIECNPESATIMQGRRIAEITRIAFDSIIFARDSTLSRITEKGA